jgi:hypothetical protein
VASARCEGPNIIFGWLDWLAKSSGLPERGDAVDVADEQDALFVDGGIPQTIRRKADPVTPTDLPVEATRDLSADDPEWRAGVDRRETRAQLSNGHVIRRPIAWMSPSFHR